MNKDIMVKQNAYLSLETSRMVLGQIWTDYN